MQKKILKFILIAILIFNLTPKTYALSNFKVGNYYTFGKYYEESIIWICIDINENGPLLLSDKVITIKPFDVANPNETDKDRKLFGSNNWEDSDIRAWLNSEKINDTNVYANESGFLSELNFTASELNAIKSVTQKAILPKIDTDRKEGGVATLKDSDVYRSKYNSAYYNNVTDKMFLLDSEQFNKRGNNVPINNIDYNRTNNDFFVITSATKKAIENSPVKLTSIDRVDYFLRSPMAETPCNVLVYKLYKLTSPYGRTDLSSVMEAVAARTDNIGIRPAFYINESLVSFVGAGTGKSEFSPAKIKVKEGVALQPKGNVEKNNTENMPKEKTIVLQVGNPNMTIEGIIQEIDKGNGTAPVIIKERTMVPIRAVIEALGGKIAWDENSQKISLSYKEDLIELWVGLNSATVNGLTIESDVAPTIINNRTLIPLRFVIENFKGCSVKWDNDTRNITLKSQ